MKSSLRCLLISDCKTFPKSTLSFTSSTSLMIRSNKLKVIESKSIRTPLYLSSPIRISYPITCYPNTTHFLITNPLLPEDLATFTESVSEHPHLFIQIISIYLYLLSTDSSTSNHPQSIIKSINLTIKSNYLSIFAVY